MEKGAWYQRESAVLEEMCDFDLVNEQPSQDSDAYQPNSLAPTAWKHREKPKVDDTAVMPQPHEENLPSSFWVCVLAVDKHS